MEDNLLNVVLKYSNCAALNVMFLHKINLVNIPINIIIINFNNCNFNRSNQLTSVLQLFMI